MPLSLGVQFNIVIYSILSGFIIGILYDLYKIIRGLNIPKIIIFIEDILFWIFTALVVFAFLLYKNFAFLGPYVYVFMIATVIIYVKNISPIIYKVEMRIISIILQLLRVILKNLIYPIKLVYYNISGKK